MDGNCILFTIWGWKPGSINNKESAVLCRDPIALMSRPNRPCVNGKSLVEMFRPRVEKINVSAISNLVYHSASDLPSCCCIWSNLPPTGPDFDQQHSGYPDYDSMPTSLRSLRHKSTDSSSRYNCLFVYRHR